MKLGTFINSAAHHIQHYNIPHASIRGFHLLALNPKEHNTLTQEITQRGHTVDVITTSTNNTWQTTLDQYDGLIWDLETPLSADMLCDAPRVKVIGIPTNGTGSVDVSGQ